MSQYHARWGLTRSLVISQNVTIAIGVPAQQVNCPATLDFTESSETATSVLQATVPSPSPLFTTSVSGCCLRNSRACSTVGSIVASRCRSSRTHIEALSMFPQSTSFHPYADQQQSNTLRQRPSNLPTLSPRHRRRPLSARVSTPRDEATGKCVVTKDLSGPSLDTSQTS